MERTQVSLEAGGPCQAEPRALWNRYDWTLAGNGPSRVPLFAPLLMKSPKLPVSYLLSSELSAVLIFLSARLTRLHKEKDLNGLLNGL